MESFLLEYGDLFSKPALAFPLMGKKQACFENAANIAMSKHDFIYVEGMALFKGLSIPVHHAWLVTLDGQTFDPTWAESGDAYFGIAFSTEYLRKTFCKHGSYGLLDEALGIANLLTGLEHDFKAAVTTSPQSEIFRKTANSVCNQQRLLGD